MKSIQDLLSDTVVDLTEVKQEVLSHKRIQTFLEEEQLDESTLDKHLTELYRFVQEVHLCKGCSGLDACKMDAKGYQPVLKKRYGQIAVQYMPCEYLSELETTRKPKLKSFSSLDFSHDDFDQTPERLPVLQYIIDFVQSKEYMRGLYLHGKPGVGKTRILTVTAKRMADTQNVLYINYPDFVREIKTSIHTNSVEEKVDALKQAQILILDDFGDEGLTSDWYRDEILMPILQFRMEKKKPVFFASNYDLELLEQAFSNKVKDVVKVERLIDRIRTLSKPFELKGKNYRN